MNLEQNPFTHPMWVEKYRPETIEDCILPSHLEKFFKEIVKDGVVPNMTFSGTPGVGKTSVALALAKQMGLAYMLINTSKEGSIDVVRNKVTNFASSMSINGARKMLVLDEADNMSTQSGMQPALRGTIEECSANCSFVLTLNKKNKVMDAIFSRCPDIDFKVPPEERQDLMKRAMKRCAKILEMEGIKFDPRALGAVVKRYFPDMRETLGVLQNYGKSGSIDSGILAELKDISIDALLDSLKTKNFKSVKEWVDNNNSDPLALFDKMYSAMYSIAKPDYIPALVLVMAKYQYQAAHVANQSINTLAFCTELMSEVEFA